MSIVAEDVGKELYSIVDSRALRRWRSIYAFYRLHPQLSPWIPVTAMTDLPKLYWLLVFLKLQQLHMKSINLSNALQTLIQGCEMITVMFDPGWLQVKRRNVTDSLFLMVFICYTNKIKHIFFHTVKWKGGKLTAIRMPIELQQETIIRHL